MESVLVLGAGPQARVIPDVVTACGNLKLLGFVDVADERHLLRGDAARFPIYDGTQFPAELKARLGNFSVLISDPIGERSTRFMAQAKEAGLPFINIIHPSAIVSPNASLGQGILILPGVILGPGVSVGNHVILNTAVTIDHDSVIQDNVVFGPAVHLAGGVLVKSGTSIGVGASSAPGVTIGSNCLIGAGSVIIENIPDSVVAAGVPARVLRPRH
ncbi:MAG TPA: NeuD/PglB/VioB family sugar acetyltransferase [Dehalococcoidales bacterium]